MPHNTLRLQGGVVVNETPVLNQAGIAVSNRIRFRPDQQGLTLPEKLGGWAKFFASTITNGVVRMLWGWQDTANNQWIAFGTDNATAAELGVIQCTVNGATGLTSATGSLQNITPLGQTGATPTQVHSFGVGTQVVSVDQNLSSGVPDNSSVFVTTPISVAGIVIQGMYLANASASDQYLINLTDVLGNPLQTQFETIFEVLGGAATITGATFTGGSPNTITFTFNINYLIPVGSPFTVTGMLPINANGTYIATASTQGVSSTVTGATPLGSFTYGSGGTISNEGTVPQFTVTTGSGVITVTYPNHGFNVGDTFEVLNETLVGGIQIYGSYVVQTVSSLNTYTFTILSTSAATQNATQFQGAFPITGGTGNGTTVTLNYSTPTFTNTFNFTTGGGVSSYINVAGVTPTQWNGVQLVTAVGSHTVSFSNTTAGSWGGGGSVADDGQSLIGNTVAGGGDPVILYAFAPQAGGGTPGTAISARFWSLDNWGNDLLALPVNSTQVAYTDIDLPFQPIYYWDSTSGATSATPIAAGPTASNGMFVAMPQRQIIAWGTTGPDQSALIIDPLLIRWCDINNFNTWVAQATNQAGSFRLPSGAAIIGARQTNQQGLIWTDIELWSMQYINFPLVYSFNKIGVGCGLIGRYAHGNLGGITYWMSKTQFWMLSGEGAVAIPCPIWDVVFQDLDLVNADKITCATNTMFQEITWYFPVKSGTGENSQYIKLNISQLVAGGPPLWDYGTLDRSAWIDVSVLQQPIGFSPANQLIYQHEISPDADGVAMGESFTTGWFSIAEGDQMPFVDQVWPDFKWGYYAQTQNANINLTISGTDYPGIAVQTVGPYTVTQSTTWISPRMRHRLLSFTVAGTGTGTWWRLGGVRYRFQPDGKF